MAIGEDGITEFVIGDEVKIARGKFAGAYGILENVLANGLCTIQRGETTYVDVSIADLEAN